MKETVSTVRIDDRDLARRAPLLLCLAALLLAALLLALYRGVISGAERVQTFHVAGTVIAVCAALLLTKRPLDALLRRSVLKKHGVRRVAVFDGVSEGGRGKRAEARLHFEDGGGRIAVRSSRGIEPSLVGRRVYVLVDPQDRDTFSVLLSTAGEPDGTDDGEKAEVSRNGE